MTSINIPSQARPPVIQRRHFVQSLGALGLAWTPFYTVAESLRQVQNTNASAIVAGKDQRLIVRELSPVVLETPLALLAEQPLTQLDRLFVRNCQQSDGTADLHARPLKRWKVAISGMVNQVVSLDASELSELEQVEHEMVLQCSGNSRTRYAATAPIPGTPWGNGGMGNVRFAGVRLQRVLDKYEIKIDSRARFVTAEGSDYCLPGKDDFAHSLPIDDVLARSFLALRLNGQPLPAIHGGPIRLVTPGVYGTMHVKWLQSLRFEAVETRCNYQLPQYRVPLSPIQPGTEFEFTTANSRSNWDMKVKSVLLFPATNAKIPSGKVKIHGVAFNDGKAPIDTVLISWDRGDTWRRANLKLATSPYAWSTFEMELHLKPGYYPIWSRAVDALGRSQPLDGSIYWNPNGYEWNGIDKIEIVVA